MSEPETKVDDARKVAEINPQEEPEKELKELKFSYIEPFAGIFFAVLATVVFLWFPEIITVVFIGGYVIPTFDEEVIKTLWVLIPGILWGLLHIGIECAYLHERRYTKRLSRISIIGHVLTLICAAIIFIPYRIVFWEYIDWVHTYLYPVSEGFGKVLEYPNLIVLFIMIIVSIIESANLIRKAKKTEENEGEEDEDNSDGVVNADQADQTEQSEQATQA